MMVFSLRNSFYIGSLADQISAIHPSEAKLATQGAVATSQSKVEDFAAGKLLDALSLSLGCIGATSLE